MDNLDNSMSSPIPVAEFICLSTLAALPGVYIKQKFEKLEAVTGIETPNVYKVYPADHEGNKASKKPIFKCKEKSDCCQR